MLHGNLRTTDCCQSILRHRYTQGGAPGSEALRKSEVLHSLLQQQKDSDKLYAAMCAAPAIVLESHGLLAGKKATAHPAFVDKLSDSRYCGVSMSNAIQMWFKNTFKNSNANSLHCWLQCC